MRNEPSIEGNITPDIKVTAPWRLRKVTALPNYQLAVEFIDGSCGFVAMQQKIMSLHAGVFAALKDKKIFDQVMLIHGVATWPGNIDLAPDAMFDAIRQFGTWHLH